MAAVAGLVVLIALMTPALAMHVGEPNSAALAQAGTAHDALADLEDIAAELDVPVHILGTTGGESLEIKGIMTLTLNEMREVYDIALERMIAGAHH